MKFKMQNTILLYIIPCVILLFSISSYKLIPFAVPDGLDFNNIYSYERCDKVLSQKKFSGDIYLATGTDCGDAMGRGYVYPPLLYLTLTPFKYFKTFPSALLAWRIIIITSLLICIFLFLGSLKSFLLTLPITVLMFLQFPMLFALERGNNDILLIILWTLSFVSYNKKYYKLCGFLAMSSVFMKVYPLFPFSMLLAGILISAIINFKHGIKDKLALNFIKGSILAFVVNMLIFPKFWYSFLVKISGFASMALNLSFLNHSIQDIFEKRSVAMLSYIIAMTIWIIYYRYAKSDNSKKVFFAGVLSISTFYSNVTYDYNLITTYPLIIVIFCSLIEQFKTKQFVVLLFILIGIFGNRLYFEHSSQAILKLRFALQFISLIMIALIDLPYKRLSNIFKMYKYDLKLKLQGQS